MYACVRVQLATTNQHKLGQHAHKSAARGGGQKWGGVKGKGVETYAYLNTAALAASRV